MQTQHPRTPTYSKSSINDEPSSPLSKPNPAQLSSMQWKGLQEVCNAEQQGREAVIADGVRDSLIELGLILPDMDRYHRITEKAKSLLQQAAPENH